MELDLLMLARYAEVAPDGTLTVLGGGWDTIGVPAGAPAPPNGVGVLQGSIAIRLLFNTVTETGRQHTFRLYITDEDGGQLGQYDGELDVHKNPGVPLGWPQNFCMALPIPGIVIPKFGLYRVSLEVGGHHVGDRPFRIQQT